MQDEVNEKTMALCIKGGKISAQILKAALTKLLAEIEKQKQQSKKMGGQNRRVEPMNFTNSPFERMMRQRPGTDSDHPCISCRHRRECGYMMHQCRKKFRSLFGDTAPPVSGTVSV